MKLGFAVIPDLETIDKVIEVQRNILPICAMIPILQHQSNLPHITLIQGNFKALDSCKLMWRLNRVLQDIDDYVKNKNSNLELTLNQIEYVEQGWYFLMTQYSKWLHELHIFVFEHLKDQMIVTNQDKEKNISSYSELERDNYLNYGYRYIGDAFQPHITVGRTSHKKRAYNEVQIIEIIKKSLIPRTFKISLLTIYECGENGSHAYILNSIKIGE